MQNFQGTLWNNDDDNSSGTWTNSSGLSGSIAPGGPDLFVRANGGLQPSGESKIGTGPNAANNTKYQFTQTLEASGGVSDNFFQGREVVEASPVTGTDGCYNSTPPRSPHYPGGPFTTVSGNGWAVGYPGNLTNANSNTWGADVIGWPPAGIAWYRNPNNGAHLPCSTTLYQSMYVVYTSGTNPFATYGYVKHTIQAYIFPTYLVVAVDGHGYTMGY